MEDLPIKAIVIGVSIFVTMIVFSTILIYFNTAQGISNIISKRTDIASVYDDIIVQDEVKGVLIGVQIRSLISKYAGKEDVKIDLSVGEVKHLNVNNSWIDNAGVISEAKLDKINPVWKYKVEKVKSGDNTYFKVSSNVEE